MRHILLVMAMSLTFGVSAADYKGPKPLDLVTPVKVAKVFKKKMAKDLKACLARWERKNHKQDQGLVTKEIPIQTWSPVRTPTTSKKP